MILFFVGRLYSSMGLPNASLVQPINFAMMFGALTTFFNIYVAAYGQFTAILIQRAIAGPVNKILFNVIPKALAAMEPNVHHGHGPEGRHAGRVLTHDLSETGAGPRRILPISHSFWQRTGCFETLCFRKEYKRLLKQVIAEGKIDFDKVEAVGSFDAGGAPMGLESTAVRHADRKKGLRKKPNSPTWRRIWR